MKKIVISAAVAFVIAALTFRAFFTERHGPGLEDSAYEVSGRELDPSGVTARKRTSSRRRREPSRISVTSPDRDGKATKARLVASADLTPKSSTGRGELILTVLDEDDSTLSGVLIRLEGARRPLEAVTGGSGEARFEELPKGFYALRVEAPGRPLLRSARKIPLDDAQKKHLSLRLGNFDQSISGRVRDKAGVPIQEFQVMATPMFFESRGGDLVPEDELLFVATTSHDGAYKIRGLEARDYQVGPLSRDRYPSVSRLVRAGEQSADFVVDEGRTVRVDGSVRDPEGRPLGGVQVTVSGQARTATRTSEQGAYVINLRFTAVTKVYRVNFTLPGYRDTCRRLRREELEGSIDRRLDVDLEPLGETVTVVGTLFAVEDNGAPEGARFPISGETIHLRAPKLGAHHQTVTDFSGVFQIADVEPGDDYRLWVNPKGDFMDLAEAPVVVPPDGLELELVLRPTKTGRISGVILDSRGAPLPGFRVVVRSTAALSKTETVTSSRDGRFEAVSVPAGSLIFQTWSQPRFTVTEVALAEGEDKQVVLMLDVGRHEVSGLVTDRQGQVVPRAELFLRANWSLEEGKSSSYRTSVTDQEGHFRFSGLGSKPHTLTVKARGYRTVNMTCEVGTTAQIRLAPAH